MGIAERVAASTAERAEASSNVAMEIANHLSGRRAELANEAAILMERAAAMLRTVAMEGLVLVKEAA